jgi:nitric oxide reductase NorQ protein
VDAELAGRLALIGAKVRNLKEHGFEEGVSTRLLIYAGSLVRRGVAARRAADISIISAVSDDATVQSAIADIVDMILP